MSEKLKICLVGGEDAHKRIEISQRLIDEGFEVTLMGTKKFDCPPPIHFIIYNLNRKLNPLADFKTLKEYRRIFKQANYDVIQTFDTKPAFLVPLAVKSLNSKVVCTVTGLGTIFMSNSIRNKVLRSMYRLLHKLAKPYVAHTTFQNEDDQGYFVEKGLVSTSKTSLIFGSGIRIPDSRQMALRDNARFTFICVARLVYEKGIVNFLEAARLCHDQGYTFRFLLIGPLEEESKRLNSQILKQFGSIVEWLGARNDVNDLMLASDAFVLPTFREGLSRVILEACLVGIPVITTNVTGTREIIRHNKEGFLINVNDSEALAHYMIKMATNIELTNTLAQNAYQRVSKFGLDVISKQYINLYKSL